MVEPGYFTALGDDVFRETIDVDYFGTLWPIRAAWKASGPGSLRIYPSCAWSLADRER